MRQYTKRKQPCGEDYVNDLPDEAVGVTVNGDTVEYLIPWEGGE